MCILIIALWYSCGTVKGYQIDTTHHSVKTRSHRICRDVKVFNINKLIFPTLKRRKKTAFGAVSRDILWFDRYLGVTMTTSLQLPHHCSVTVIMTITTFLNYATHIVKVWNNCLMFRSRKCLMDLADIWKYDGCMIPFTYSVKMR